LYQILFGSEHEQDWNPLLHADLLHEALARNDVASLTKP
jgi:hypothetical protein